MSNLPFSFQGLPVEKHDTVDSDNQNMIPYGSRLSRMDTDFSADISFVDSGKKFKNSTAVSDKIYAFLTYPKSSLGARLFQVFIVLVIMSSIIISGVETMQEFSYSNPSSFGWNLTELIFSIILLLEWLLRFLSYPYPKIEFFKRMINVTDFLGTTPIILDIFSLIAKDKTPRGVEILSLLRLLRFIKLVQMSRQARDLGTALGKSRDAFALMILIYVIGIGFWATIIYYVELPFCEFDYSAKILVYNGGPDQSVIDATWWSVVTMSTVGFGDVVPKTWAGKVIAGFAIITSVMTLSIPLTIVSSVLNEVFQRNRLRQAHRLKRQEQQNQQQYQDTYDKIPDPLKVALSNIANKVVNTVTLGKSDSSRPAFDPKNFFKNGNSEDASGVDQQLISSLEDGTGGIIKNEGGGDLPFKNIRWDGDVPQTSKGKDNNVASSSRILEHSNSTKVESSDNSSMNASSTLLERINRYKEICEYEIKENERRVLEMQLQNERLLEVMEGLDYCLRNLQAVK
ncbi:hypothetical protein HK098_005917 [Nowakowskiella sp. JEL0407]|nr:hypothetical protein HK098_005917 [Nowakowskiella sp. JEL0407]